MKIGIIGVGAYSNAMTLQLYKNNKDIIMWTESDKVMTNYLKDGCVKNVIPGVELPKEIRVTKSYEEVCEGKDIIFILSAAAYVGAVCDEINKYITKSTVVCICSKGIENTTSEFLSDIAYKKLKTKNIAIISGPSFAVDMANNNPIGLSIASKSKKVITLLKKTMQNDTLKLRETNDLIGVQICGAVKNVIALAAGMLAGMNYPESTQSFLITESIHDIKSLITKLGGNPKTILSFAGIGDLLLTCTSTKSRNFSFGYLIGSGATKEEIDKYLSETTVEGYNTLKSIYKLIRNKKIKMPIIDLIYKIIMNNEPPQELVKFLINKK